MTDSEAIQQVRSGEMDGLRVLYDRHRGRIYQLGCRYLGDAAEAEDLVQHVFIKAYENATKFREEAQVSTWLYRIAVNAALERRRKRRTVGIDDLHPLGSDALGRSAHLEAEVRSGWSHRPAMAGADFDADPEGVAQRRSIQERLAEALEELSPTQRLAFVLRHWEGMSIREIAEVLGAAEGTVKSHLFRAVRTLRVQLADLTP
ncbi:MAG: sigma-70 family RNA polymerase sigma factor [Acidobacteriota bacterium]|jgi:RNA polymerase sigma-70 factor (ECF subfamily)